MEVHHHPHVGPKQLKEYLLEGLMIFLAVSMGFIAENIRESITKHEKEKVLIESLILNLKADTAMLNTNIQRNLRKNDLFDSLLNLANTDLNAPQNLYNFYTYFIKGTTMSLFLPSDAAMTQIKTDGGLNLISKQGVLDSILNYDKQNRVIERHNGVYTEESEGFWKTSYKLMEIRLLKDTSFVDYFNGRVMKNKIPPPLVNSPQDLKIFFGSLTRILLLTQVNRNHMITQRDQAIRLMNFLKHSYTLE